MTHSSGKYNCDKALCLALFVATACLFPTAHAAAQLEVKAGTQLVVQGTTKADKLNLRVEASGGSRVLVEIPPDATGLVATGRTQKNGADTWIEVKFGSQTGWVNSRLVAKATAQKQLAKPSTPAPAERAPQPPKGATASNVMGHPKPGTKLRVQGAATTDKLNLRREASGTAPILMELPPDATGLLATGRSMKNDADTWIEIRFRNQVGWVHSNFVRDAEITANPPQPAKPQPKNLAAESANAESVKSTNPAADCDSDEPGKRLAGCSALLQITDLTPSVRAVAFSRRSDTYLERKSFDRAIADRAEALKREPNDVQYRRRLSAAYHLRGLGHTMKKDHELALADYGEAIKHDETNHAALEARGLTFAETGALDKAIEDLSTAVRLDSASKRYALELASLYERRGSERLVRSDFDGALDDYGNAIRLSEENASLYLYRGDAYWGRRNLLLALEDYDKALALKPGHVDVLLHRGQVRLEAERFEQSVADFTEVIKNVPKNIHALLFRAIAFEKANKLSEAMEDYRATLKIDPKNTKAKSSLDRLTSFRDWRQKAQR